MAKKEFDIIVIGAGSGGLSVGLFMNQAGFKVLMVSRSDHDIGGDCLNDGCVPSKSLIHAAKIIHQGREAEKFGLKVSGNADISKVTSYIKARQLYIRKHENAQWLRDQGLTVALGSASFSGKDEIEVEGKKYTARKIVIATGSKPRKLKVVGIDKVNYFDNESIFHIKELPKKLLCIGGGPIGIEIAQAMSRLGSKVTVVNQGGKILEQDDPSLSGILLKQLKAEGVEFLMNSEVEKFNSATQAVVVNEEGKQTNITFDAVFVAIGREIIVDSLNLSAASVEMNEGKIVVDKCFRTSNKNVLLCGDVVGDLQFSHAAEFHARIILNNFFSPFKKKLNNEYLSWVTFTDPELATFGLNEKQLKEQNIAFRKLEKDFKDDDRAITDNYQYGKLILYVSEAGFLRKQKILGGTMIAPNAGELVQELILATANKISVKAIFNKIYPYPVASRINQGLITDLMSEGLSGMVKSFLHKAYRIFS